MSLTHLNPNALPDRSISSSKIDATVASKSYVDEAIANLSDELKNNPSINLSEEKLKTMYFMQPTPAKTTRITNNVWNAMKIDSAKVAD